MLGVILWHKMIDVLLTFWFKNAILLPVVNGEEIYQLSEVIMIKGDNEGIYYTRRNKLCEQMKHKFGIFSSLSKKLKETHTINILNKRWCILKRMMFYCFITNVYTYISVQNAFMKYFRVPSHLLQDYMLHKYTS